jgi:O-antigen/teichoic acid export membrane protein
MFSQGVPQAATIILGVILVRLITQESLGTYRQVLLAYTIMASLFSLQLGNSLYYYLPKMRPDQRRTLLTQTFGGTFILSAARPMPLFNRLIQRIRLRTKRVSREAFLEQQQRGPGLK